MDPFISICIPAYKRTEYLLRLLDSIVHQSYKYFEVIVTDDSNDNSVENLVLKYSDKIRIAYSKNSPALGTPENWNASIRMAKGEWIKLMHDDDWFSSPDSLEQFAEAIRQNPQAHFFFSAYSNHFEGKGTSEDVFINSFRWKALLKDPVTLFSQNVIGPPSVTLHKNNSHVWYDKAVKWVVDIDFYIRFLKDTQPVYIPKPLINVGINKEQVTQYTFRVAAVEIPENFHLLKKVGQHHLKHVLVYDAWWRMMRNLRVKSIADLRVAGYTGDVPGAIQSMIHWQRTLPQQALSIGFLSKAFMLFNYIRNINRL